MKIISFLGLNAYQVTKYKNPENPGSGFCETKYYQEALAQFYEPDSMYIFVTEKVEKYSPSKFQKLGDGSDYFIKQSEKKSNWEQLRDIFESKYPHVNLIPMKNIPEQNTVEDIWTIFNKVNECLEEGDEVIFDITHSFRSVPIVALLAVSYFRVVRDIKIKALIYGAFEAKNIETNETPTFDLLPVVRLFDWLTATDQFLKTGNGGDLAALLQNAGGYTQELGNRILEISQGLQLLRPMDVMAAADALPDDIKRAKPDLGRVVPPFEMLLNRVVDEYGNFALSEPENYEATAKVTLCKQIDLVDWYASKGLEVQALSMAREWLPSLLCHYFQKNPMSLEERREMEILCAGGKQNDYESKYASEFKEISKELRVPITQLWGKLANLRNDVLHAGFRKNPRSANDISSQTQEVVEELKKIALLWQVLD